MGEVLFWPTREPGRPYRWVTDLQTGRPSPTCVHHKVATNDLGVCFDCVSEWRAELGAADPDGFLECVACGFPLHPAAEGPGVDTCPSCDPRGASPAPAEDCAGVPYVSPGSPAGTDVRERPVSEDRTAVVL
jgi:hypothetical protein